MRSTLRKALFAIALMAPAAAFAVGESGFGVFGSYWDTEEADEAAGVGVKFKLGIFEIRGTYFEDVTADTDPEVLDLEVEAIPVDAGLVFNFAPNSPLNPYVGAGASYIVLDTNVADIDDEWGWYGLIGGEMGMATGVSFMFEVQYRGVEGTVTADPGDFPGGLGITTTQNVDLDLSGAAANVGVVWRF